MSPTIKSKADSIITALNNGTPTSIYRGKRLTLVDRNLYSFRITDKVRLLWNIITKEHKLMTHQEYNKVLGCKHG